MYWVRSSISGVAKNAHHVLQHDSRTMSNIPPSPIPRPTHRASAISHANAIFPHHFFCEIHAVMIAGLGTTRTGLEFWEWAAAVSIGGGGSHAHGGMVKALVEIASRSWDKEVVIFRRRVLRVSNVPLRPILEVVIWQRCESWIRLLKFQKNFAVTWRCEYFENSVQISEGKAQPRLLPA
jgi:hypothetical protein